MDIRPITDFCVYTIVDGKELDRRFEKRDTSPFKEKRRWVTAEIKWQQGRIENMSMPVLFGDATQCSHLLYWGMLTNLEVKDDGTSFVVDRLRPFSPRRKTQDLVLLRNGKKIASGFIKPYAICYTPQFLKLKGNPGLAVKQTHLREGKRRVATPSKGKRKQRVEKPFTIEMVKSALIAVRPKMSEPQMSMLRGHYLYRVLSMERIAIFGGYSYYGSANLQYGKLCGRIARELGYRSPGSQTYTIASVSPDRDNKGAFQWQMDNVVVKALERIGWFSQVVKEVVESSEPLEIAETERDTLIQARIGQGPFRTNVIALWGSCAVTGCSMPGVLVASHIVPWAKCTTNEERLDPLNGLLLTPNLDKLFDRFLISFKNDGAILLSKELNAEERTALGVTARSRLRFVRPAMLPYLKRHRDPFLKKQKIRDTGAN